jgi:hypothetical protein
MATTTVAVQKKTKISIKGNQQTLFNDDAFAIQIIYNNANDVKSIQISEAQSVNTIQGNYLNIQLRFDNNENYINVQKDANSNWGTAYHGKGSSIIIDDLKQGINKTIKVNKTNNESDWTQTYQGTDQVIEIILGELQDDKPKPQGSDKYGISKVYPDAPSGTFLDSPKYKWSTHNTGPRDSFWIDDMNLVNVEQTGYFKIKASTTDEQLSYKCMGGDHGGNGDSPETRQGRCYAIGVNFDGSPHFAKEYPYHPKTPKFYNHIQLADPNFKTMGKILDRWVGIKAIHYVKNGSVFFECWVDNEGLVNDKPANKFKKFFTVVDDGNLKNNKGEKGGEPYLENQGKANGGNGKFYIRLDMVSGGKQDPTKTHGVSIREITPPAQ